jgi:hypothetical protein
MKVWTTAETAAQVCCVLCARYDVYLFLRGRLLALIVSNDASVVAHHDFVWFDVIQWHVHWAHSWRCGSSRRCDGAWWMQGQRTRSRAVAASADEQARVAIDAVEAMGAAAEATVPPPR